ncbi:WlaTC/HtrL family glycosyltransferase [Acinetobacter zhairhuonensis]|uniref:WlaTC/HtrL family glycosyltransferase n=1 Tax=Acinetobacter sp. A7.4 TaxID=2919921 RepID=UPI001F4E0B0C|nr:WlaTC/HtrL family glycosyltransferase [Acinetobacter sp. A7.4]MCJ8161079.1 hypothetical protein [Acinetobacter sp. A7.4]
MSITIVTAFSDIGRDAWSVENGHPSYLGRSTDNYFKYFSNLADLEKDMIVFTSQEFVTRIKKIRGDKPKNIMTLDLNKKFIKCIIDGVIVAAPSKWLEFYNLVYTCQKDMLSKKIIDNDQGVYLQASLKQPDLFKIHYLGEDCWFDVFKRYDETTHLNLKNRYKKLMGYF